MRRKSFDRLISVTGLFIGAFIAAAVMLLLGGLGLWHGRRVPDTTEIFAGRQPARDLDLASAPGTSPR
jgi:hypothetical protein